MASRRPSPMRASPSRSMSICFFRLAANHEVLITIEEGSIGGFGSFVMQTLAEEGALDGFGVTRAEIPLDGVAGRLPRP